MRLPLICVLLMHNILNMFYLASQQESTHELKTLAANRLLAKTLSNLVTEMDCHNYINNHLTFP